MGKWIEQYGELLLTGIAGTLLLIVIATSGMLSLIGSKAKMPEKLYEEYGDYNTFAGLCRLEKPEIVCDAGKQWHEGEIIPIKEAFQGIDGNGELIEVKVINVTDRSGKTYMDVYQKENRQVIFPQAGIYMFELKAQDSERRSVIRKLELSVDNRKVEK